MESDDKRWAEHRDDYTPPERDEPSNSTYEGGFSPLFVRSMASAGVGGLAGLLVGLTDVHWDMGQINVVGKRIAVGASLGLALCYGTYFVIGVKNFVNFLRGK